MIFLNNVKKLADSLHPHDSYDFLCTVNRDPWVPEKIHNKQELSDLIIDFYLENEKHYFLLLEWFCDSMHFVLIKNCNDNPVYGIEVNGMTIYNPYMSECGRFPVDPFISYGLDVKTVNALCIINDQYNYSTEC